MVITGQSCPWQVPIIDVPDTRHEELVLAEVGKPGAGESKLRHKAAVIFGWRKNSDFPIYLEASRAIVRKVSIGKLSSGFMIIPTVRLRYWNCEKS
jgi:hypothetical protein